MKSIFSLVRTSLKLGWDNCLAIVVHRFFIFTGYYKRCLPLATCPIPELIKDVPNIVSSQTEWEDQARSSCLIEADRLLDGHIKYFGKYFHKVGTPPLWFIDPLNGQNFCESSIHWTHCKIFKSFDIKRVWEASRWTWAPLFARAWRYTGQDIYIDVLNEWIKDWSIKNYFCGAPNWMCGQEVAIRLLHALQAWQIIESPRKIPKLSKGRKKFVELHLRRIDLTTRYAKAQQNNHWVSEAAALFIAGHWLTLFSDQKDFDANYFAQKGRQSLERSVGELLLQDGSFSQNSLTYHRLLLDTLIQVELWRIRFQLPEFSHAFKKRCYFATKWLKAFVDPITGDGPNLGHNDGALCYKFDNLSYRDFRSTLQLASVLFLGEKCLPQGPWDESFNWIDINLEVNKKTKEPFPCLQYFSDGGYALLRPNQKTWALFRLPKYKFRPAHADPLHIDLWNNGENILRDGGSYSYNSNENDMTYFSGIASHNSLQVDDKEPMTRLSRFLWGDWLNLTLSLKCPKMQILLLLMRLIRLGELDIKDI